MRTLRSHSPSSVRVATWHGPRLRRVARVLAPLVASLVAVCNDWGSAPSTTRGIDMARPASGTPWINFHPVVRLRASYEGAKGPVHAMEQDRDPDRPAPLSLAKGDFDGDGVPDLAAGYVIGRGAQSRGLIVLHRGNLDTIYP